MHASSQTRIDELTPEQVAQLDHHQQTWTDACQSTAPVDRSAAEAGVDRAYRAAGRPPPAHIVWCNGPIELACDWERSRRVRGGGANLRAALFDRQRVFADLTIATRLGPQTRKQMRARSRLQTSTVGRAVMQAVLNGVSTGHPSAGRGLWRALTSVLRLRRSVRTWLTLGQSGYCQHELTWLATYAFLHDACGLRFETEALEGHRLLGMNAGWVVPHEHVCWLSERHCKLSFDAGGRLHGPSEPALAYPDGWTCYAWKGIMVPADVIARPERITLDRIDQERDIFVRRCLIEILTPQRFIEMGGAARLAQDETGTLWHKTWWAGDAWAAVEVVNGTPHPDGTYQRYFLQVPPEIRSARAAVAWSYGMSEAQYARLGVRT